MAANLRFFQQKYNQAAAHCHIWPETLQSDVLWNSCYLRPLLKPNMKLGTYAETKGSGKAVGGGLAGIAMRSGFYARGHYVESPVMPYSDLGPWNCCVMSFELPFPLHLPQFKVQLMKFEKISEIFQFFPKFQFFSKFENFFENFRFFQKRPFF